MSNDNQRLQLSIEQKNGKIRTLENKYGFRIGVTCNIENRAACNMWQLIIARLSQVQLEK